MGAAPAAKAESAPEGATAQNGEPPIEALQRDLAEVAAKRDEYLEGWQRALAEFSNYKKRVEREREQAYQDATGRVIKRFLEIVDDLERALKSRPSEGDGVAWASGIELIYRKLLTALEAEGVKPMEAQGQHFDPNRHEAIGQVAADGFESGQIVEVLQSGYLIGDRVLRPALVRIAS
jgi:molecular chaperone GrpE